MGRSTASEQGLGAPVFTIPPKSGHLTGQTNEAAVVTLVPGATNGTFFSGGGAKGSHKSCGWQLVV